MSSSAESFESLFSEAEIKEILVRLAREIDAAYAKSDSLLCVGVLKGAWIFMADLVRLMERPVEIDFIRARSYGAEQESSGNVLLIKDVEEDLTGRDVLVFEEIIDTGRTLKKVVAHLKEKGARSVKVVALLDKKSRRVVPFEADFLGVDIPDKFVVGYGLDWGERYRSLADIRVVPPNATS